MLGQPDGPDPSDKLLFVLNACFQLRWPKNVFWGFWGFHLWKVADHLLETPKIYMKIHENSMCVDIIWYYDIMIYLDGKNHSKPGGPVTQTCSTCSCSLRPFAPSPWAPAHLSPEPLRAWPPGSQGWAISSRFQQYHHWLVVDLPLWKILVNLKHLKHPASGTPFFKRSNSWDQSLVPQGGC